MLQYYLKRLGLKGLTNAHRLLCSNTLTMARKTYDMYVAEHPHTDNTNWPLINLADMILTCVERLVTPPIPLLIPLLIPHPISPHLPP